MKKLLLMLFLMIFAISCANAANYLTCDQAMQTGKPFVLYLHSNTCYSCKQFTPIFTRIMNGKASYNVVDINYSYPQGKDVCSSAESKTIPAVYVVDPKQRTRSKIKFETYFDDTAFTTSLTNLMGF